MDSSSCGAPCPAGKRDSNQDKPIMKRLEAKNAKEKQQKEGKGGVLGVLH